MLGVFEFLDSMEADSIGLDDIRHWNLTPQGFQESWRNSSVSVLRRAIEVWKSFRSRQANSRFMEGLFRCSFVVCSFPKGSSLVPEQIVGTLFAGLPRKYLVGVETGCRRSLTRSAVPLMSYLKIHSLLVLS